MNGRCKHPVYSRFLGTRWVKGVEMLRAGCRDCDAEIEFPALAKLARKKEKRDERKRKARSSL